MTTLFEERRKFAREFGLLANRWQQLISERLKALNLTEARWCVLYWLSRSPEGLSQTVLAERACVEAPTLVRTLDILERQGLVRREPSKRDRRIKVVRLTEAAAPLIAEGRRQRDLLREEAMGDLTPEDYRILNPLIQQMRERLDKVDALDDPAAAEAEAA